jgi:hypothetical protein
MDEQLVRIERNTRAKENINLILSDVANPIHTLFSPPLILKPEGNYEVALLELDTYYTFPNITEKNNTLKYRKVGEAWITLKIPTGSYEIHSIRDWIFKKVGDKKKIILQSDGSTLKCTLTIEKGYEVSFEVDDSIANLLGFKKRTYPEGENLGEEIVNILQINSILVHMDIVKNSYIKGVSEPVIYAFFPNVQPGVKIVETPRNLVYLPITTNYITSIQVWLTDQDNKLLNTQGEYLTVRLHLREC